MKAVLSLSLLTCLALAFPGPGVGTAKNTESGSRHVLASDADAIYTSTGQVAAKSATDSFYVYGGPGTAEGRFQTFIESPGGAPDAQGWVGVDLSYLPAFWHASSVNSSSTGDGNPQGFTGGVGNHGIISHHDGSDYVGYGNSWDDWLVFSFDPAALDPLFDAAVDTSRVRISFEYKHFLETDFDFLSVEWFQAGASRLVSWITGSSYNEITGYYEKRDYDSDEHGGIVYEPGDYTTVTPESGESFDGIQLRLRVTSDGGWSDEDGIHTTNGLGAAAVDNIRVYVNDTLVSEADFEQLVAKDDLPEGETDGHDVGAGPGTSGWAPTPSIFVGDFHKIFGNVQDLDPCRDNLTPVFTFINDGMSPSNCPGCPIAPSISPTWSYGIPGGYVVNYSGGLTNGVEALDNYIQSPEIVMDLPGAEDDVANGGVVLGFSLYNHLPLENGIFAVWKVRSAVGDQWTSWRDNSTLSSSEDPEWQNQVIDVSHLIEPNADRAQIRLGVVDLAGVIYGPANDATPSPLYDNVYLKKYRIGGPSILAYAVDLTTDCFPVDGTLTGSCRFDASAMSSISPVPGDSIVVTIVPLIPGSELSDPVSGGVMYVAHLANPEFATERDAALSSMAGVTTSTDPSSGWPIYSYEISGQQAYDRFGGLAEGRYFFDLLDGTSNGLPHISNETGWIFPGDVIHYRFESSDTAGGHTVLPDDTTGFADFGPSSVYPRAFSMRALPTMVHGEHPRLLFWNDAGHGEAENDYYSAFHRMCLVEGQDFDVYTTKAPRDRRSNGLGSGGFHGAIAQQLAGYDILVYALGDLRSPAISDGSAAGYSNDFSNDLAVLNAWANADADRYHVYFGDNFARSMEIQGSATQSYLNQVLGVECLDDDVGPTIDGQLIPTLAPTGLGSSIFGLDYAANGGCLDLNDFDHIAPIAGGAVAAHEFLDRNQAPYPVRVAGSVEWLRVDGNGNRKHTIVFPYDLSYVLQPSNQEVPPYGGSAGLLHQVLSAFGMSACAVAVEQPDIPTSSHQFHVNQNHPNPFNPSTRISFSLAQRGEIRITLYNVRGERVAVLLDEVRESGPGYVDWHGLDDRGAEVASGIYLYKVQAEGQEVIKKMALIR